jgi:hypothetical protein
MKRMKRYSDKITFRSMTGIIITIAAAVVIAITFALRMTFDTDAEGQLVGQDQEGKQVREGELVAEPSCKPYLEGTSSPNMTALDRQRCMGHLSDEFDQDPCLPDPFIPECRPDPTTFDKTDEDCEAQGLREQYGECVPHGPNPLLNNTIVTGTNGTQAEWDEITSKFPQGDCAEGEIFIPNPMSMIEEAGSCIDKDRFPVIAGEAKRLYE